MLTFENEQIRSLLTVELGVAAAETSAVIDSLPCNGLDKSIREDVAEITASPLIPKDIPVRGFVYHVESGTFWEIALF